MLFLKDIVLNPPPSLFFLYTEAEPISSRRKRPRLADSVDSLATAVS